MAPKRKTVFTAEPEQIARIDGLVRDGLYRSASEFLREAIDRRLADLEVQMLAEQVERYCAAGHADEDSDLVDMQALDEED